MKIWKNEGLSAYLKVSFLRTRKTGLSDRNDLFLGLESRISKTCAANDINNVAVGCDETAIRQNQKVKEKLKVIFFKCCALKCQILLT